MLGVRVLAQQPRPTQKGTTYARGLTPLHRQADAAILPQDAQSKPDLHHTIGWTTRKHANESGKSLAIIGNSNLSESPTHEDHTALTLRRGLLARATRQADWGDKVPARLGSGDRLELPSDVSLVKLPTLHAALPPKAKGVSGYVAVVGYLT